MRVLCVNHDDFSLDSFPWQPGDPQIGSDYEVVRVTTGMDKKGKHFPAYKLKGYPLWVYDQRNFATLSDDMAEELREATVNLETVPV